MNNKRTWQLKTIWKTLPLLTVFARHQTNNPSLQGTKQTTRQCEELNIITVIAKHEAI